MVFLPVLQIFQYDSLYLQPCQYIRTQRLRNERVDALFRVILAVVIALSVYNIARYAASNI
jgi:hypothetical protein